MGRPRRKKRGFENWQQSEGGGRWWFEFLEVKTGDPRVVCILGGLLGWATSCARTEDSRPSAILGTLFAHGS